ncbi:hypothetical protein DRO64_07715, partial [Candidatus Bathyarchaeota archaeon]
MSSDDSKETLKPSSLLYGTAAATYFSDSLLLSFFFPYAVVLGVSFDQMGMMRSARNLFQNILQIGWGEISERFSRKTLIAMGYFSSGCIIAALLFFREPEQLILLIILQSILCSAAVPSWSSLLADYTTIRNRGKVLGRIGAVRQFSGVLATLIVALMTYEQHGEITASSFTVPFVLSAAMAILAAVLVIFVKEVKVERPTCGWSGITSPLLNGNFR